MADPERIEKSRVDVVDHNGVVAIRTEFEHGEKRKGTHGVQVEYMTFPDPRDGLRIARALALKCMAKIRIGGS